MVLIARSVMTLTIVILIATLYSCARVPASQLVHVAEDEAMIYVYRLTQDHGYGNSQLVIVNDRKIARLHTPAYTYVAVPPGIVNANILGLSGASVSFKAEAGKLFVKSSLQKVFNPFTSSAIDVVSLMDFETGYFQIKGCRLSSDTPVRLSPNALAEND